MRKLVVLLAVAAACGCSRESAPVADKANAPKTEAAPANAGSPEGATAPAMPPGHPETGAPAAAGPETVLTGTVVETMDSGGYTYMKLKTTGGEVWSAVNAAKVAKGQTVHVANPMPMDGFESKTLGRKFDRIFFGTLFDPANAPAASAAAPPAMGGAAPAAAMGGPSVPPQVAAQHAAAGSGPEVTEKISVAKAEGADGRTIAELYGQRAPLKGKTVAVRGKVVKFNGGIMGKNWIHLRDGSGTPEGKNNDLTVTTDAAAKVGDVVVAKGTVTTDRDFGAGYTYALLLEDAKLSK